MTEPQADTEELAVPIELDGRRRRRDRNRDAVVDAMLDLHKDGNLSPSVADLADRSGVSHRSVFRYFDDLDELFRVAIERSTERLAPFMKIHRYCEGNFEERLPNLIEQRVKFFDQAAPSARAQRLRSPFSAVLANEMAETRAVLRTQIEEHFAPELADGPDTKLDAVDALLSFESVDFLREHRGYDHEQLCAVLKQGVEAILLGST